jgi:tetratricopeptide (TPR) repeat protein
MLQARQALGGQPDTPFATSQDVRTWFGDTRDEILAAANQAVTLDDHRLAAQFLTTAWAIVPPDAETTWCDELRDCGHRLSTTAPESPGLAGVFRRSAAVYHARGDYRFAEAEGLQELAVRRELDDPDEHVAALDSLTRTFLARDRLHLAMDCADERLAVHIDHDRHQDIAVDLQHLGVLLLVSDRADTAVDYFTRARDAFDDLPDIPAQQHAHVRMLLGLALWQTGRAAAAEREFSIALRYLMGVPHADARSNDWEPAAGSGFRSYPSDRRGRR